MLHSPFPIHCWPVVGSACSTRIPLVVCIWQGLKDLQRAWAWDFREKASGSCTIRKLDTQIQVKCCCISRCTQNARYPIIQALRVYSLIRALWTFFYLGDYAPLEITSFSAFNCSLHAFESPLQVPLTH